MILNRYFSPDFILKQQPIFEQYHIFILINDIKAYLRGTFLFKGVVCNHCKKKAAFFKLELTNEKTQKWKLVPYIIDEFGEKYQLTKDHIIPKSKGGINHLINYQVLCDKCNQKKADSLDEDLHINN